MTTKSVLLTAAYLSALSVFSSSAVAQDGPPRGGPGRAQRTVTVQGEGRVEAKPDKVVVSIGVTSDGTTAQEAQDANVKSASALLEAMKTVAEDKDVRVSGIQLQPRWSYPQPRNDGAQQEPKIVGFTASRTYTVTLRDVAKLPDLLGKSVAAGSNQIHSISYDLADRSGKERDARIAAITDAKNKAMHIAEAFEVELGTVRTVMETGGSRPMPMYQMASRAAMSQSPDAQAGDIEITAGVSVVFDLISEGDNLGPPGGGMGPPQ